MATFIYTLSSAKYNEIIFFISVKLEEIGLPPILLNAYVLYSTHFLYILQKILETKFC